MQVENIGVSGKFGAPLNQNFHHFKKLCCCVIDERFSRAFLSLQYFFNDMDEKFSKKFHILEFKKTLQFPRLILNKSSIKVFKEFSNCSTVSLLFATKFIIINYLHKIQSSIQ